MVTKFGGSHTTDVAAIYGRFSDIDNYYAAVLRPDGKVSIRARVAGSGPTSLQTSADIGVVEGVWYNLRFSLVGSTLTLFVDGQFRAGVVDFSIGSGTVGLGGDDTAAEFDDVRVTQP